MGNAKKKAIFSGDFDPFHAGHAYVIEKSLEIVDEILVYVSQRKLSGYMLIADLNTRRNVVKKWIQLKGLEQQVSVYEGDKRSAVMHAEGYTFKICGTDHLTKKLLEHLRHIAPFKAVKEIILVARIGHAIERDMLDYFLNEGKSIHILPAVGRQLSSTDIMHTLNHNRKEGPGCIKGMVPPGMEKLIFDIYAPFAAVGRL